MAEISDVNNELMVESPDGDESDTNAIGRGFLGTHIITLDTNNSSGRGGPRQKSLTQELLEKAEAKAKQQIEKRVGKSIFKRLLNRVFGKAAETAVEEGVATEGVVATEGAVATAEGGAVAAGETGIVAAGETAVAGAATGGAAVVAATVGLIVLDVGLAIYDTKKIIELVHDTKQWNAEKAEAEKGDISNFRREILTYYHEKVGDKGHYDLNGSVVHYANGKTIDLSDPKTISEFRQHLMEEEAAQQKIIEENNSWVPDWIHNMYNSDAMEKKYLAEARLRELKSAEGGIDLWQQANAAHAKSASAPQQAPGHASNGSGAPAHTTTPAPIPAPAHTAAPAAHVEATTSGRTFGVGDSFACGITNSCNGDPKDNHAVVGSHMRTATVNVKHEITNADGTKSTITDQKTLKGALEQLDEVMAVAKKGDKVLIHTGRNDLGAVNSPAYKADLDRMAREMKAMQDMGVEVVWVLPPPAGDKDAAAVQKMADLQKEYAIKYGIHYKEIDSHVERAPDNVHPKHYDKVAVAATAGTGIQVKSPGSTKPLTPPTPSHKANSNYSNMKLTPAMAAREKQAMEYFMSEGWTREQAAAIVGNLTRESGLDHQLPGDKNKITGVYEAKGIGQWHDDRQAEFKKLFGHDLDHATYEENLKFVNYELTQGKYKKVGNQLAKETTIEGATHLLRHDYERPADKLGQEDGIRSTYAVDAYNRSTSSPGNSQVATTHQQPRQGAGRSQLREETASAAPIPQHPPTGKSHAHEDKPQPVA